MEFDEKYEKYSYEIPRCRIYEFFEKQRLPNDGTAWTPPYWERLCPYPYCPTYREFARILALILIALLFWCLMYFVMKKTAAPGGQLFQIATVCIAAKIGGWLISLTTIPELIGMLLTGIIFQNVGLVNIEGGYIEFVSLLRQIALVIVLTRAGLELDSEELKRMWLIITNLALVPWFVETVVVSIMVHYLLHYPWEWAFLLGSIIAAVSPSVVIPCLVRLGKKGYGVAKRIPTLIITVSVLDDGISVAVFGILHSTLFTKETLIYQILQGPVSIIGGIIFGVMWGLLSRYVPEKQDAFVIPLRTMMLFGGGLIAILGSERIGCGGAGPVGAILAAFVSCYYWAEQGWNVENNPVSTAFELFWTFFQPILFGLTGTQIKLEKMDAHTVIIAICCLLTGILIRMGFTILISVGARLNIKEKVFVALSWMAKATVQAALGPMTLDSVRLEKNATEQDKEYAESMMLICILSILLTAPIGAILISFTGPRLLKRTPTRSSISLRRSRRPSSFRDITIHDDVFQRVGT